MFVIESPSPAVPFSASTSTLNTNCGAPLASPAPSTSSIGGGSDLMRYSVSPVTTRRSLVDTLSMRSPPATVIHCPHCLHPVLSASAVPHTRQLIDCRKCHRRMSVGGGARTAYRRHTTVAVELAIVCVVLVIFWCALRVCQPCSFSLTYSSTHSGSVMSSVYVCERTSDQSA
jgi:hypothetical protein